MSVAASITVRVPLAIRRRPGRRTVVTLVCQQGDKVMPTRADPALVKALARAFRFQRLLDEGRYASISEMAAAERIERGYLGSLLRLTLLAPDIVEAILDGKQPPKLGLPTLMEAFPAEWLQQRHALLNTAAAPELARPLLDGQVGPVPQVSPVRSRARLRPT
jgi:hypothetical protein